MHQIENEFLRVRAREFGAELTSIYDKKNKIEFLWNADEKFWGWHAPVLFPVVGRCLNDEIIIDGQKYPMEKHGFARKSNFKLLELSEQKMVFSLTHSEDTFKHYPFQFEFLIGYRLKENELQVSYEVINEDNKTIWFQLGGHPAFAVPFNATDKYEDYYLEFGKEENSSRHFIDENGFFNGISEPVLTHSNIIPLRKDLFKSDALIFKDLKSRTVTIKGKNHTHYLKLDFHGFNYLGLWAKENAPYVCIEPWLGCADTTGNAKEFSQREGVVMLEPGEEYNPSYFITVGYSRQACGFNESF